MSLRFHFSRSVKALLPEVLLHIARSFYSSQYREAQRQKHLHARIEHACILIAEEAKHRIVSGPFAQMLYVDSAVGSALAPKLLGTYEKELSHIVELFIASQPSCLIDIGAAEGYYAVGFAHLLPNLTVVAFEATTQGQQMLYKLAALNNVQDRIRINGFCDPISLTKCLDEAPPDTLIICDVEGAEIFLLDPSLIPQLTKFCILVELHPWQHPGVKNVLTQRFAITSCVTTISSAKRVSGDFPQQLKVNLSNSLKVDAMNELRPPDMEWLLIKPQRLV
jgi:hypothetical protein